MFDFDTELKRIDKFNQKEIASANILTVEAGSTGPQGGDWGHGSRAYIRIRDEASTAWSVRINGNDFEPHEIEILIGGDCELATFKEALKFAADNI